MSKILKAENLVKQYGDFYAVNDIDLNLDVNNENIDDGNIENEDIVEIDLNDKEVKMFKKSVVAVKETNSALVGLI